MKNYISYMEEQRVSLALHQKLLDIPRQKAARRGALRWKPVLASAACLAVIAAAALLMTPPQEPAPGPGEVISSNVGMTVVPTPFPEGGEPVVGGDGGDRGAMLPMIPAVRYPEVTEELRVAGDIAWPEGSFTVELTEEQIGRILWGTEERYEAAAGALPWLLFWDGFALTGRAVYDGQGDLWQVTIEGSGESDTDCFTLTLAPGQIPPTCIVHPDAAVTDVRGVEVTGWQSRCHWDRDGAEEYVYETAFLAGGVGVRFQSVSREQNERSILLVNWATYSDGGLTLEHLLTHGGEIPAWRQEEFADLTDVRREADFAPYLPEHYPYAYSEFYGWLDYQESSRNRLHLRWSSGYDDVEIDISLPEGAWPDIAPVDAADPAAYDTRLYEIPWADTVPEAYQADFYKPIFRAEDMSLAVIEARMTEKDTGGSAYRFYVLHANGALVGYSCDGLTAAEVWALVEPTLWGGGMS